MSLLLLHRRIPVIRTLQATSCLWSSPVTHRQSYATGAGLTKRKDDGSGQEEGMPIGERIKENTKTTSYSLVILLGAGLTGGLFYVIFKELFSSNSPQNIYTAALDRCVSDPQIQDALGE